MKLSSSFVGFFIALSGCYFGLILGNVEHYATSAIKLIEKYGYPAESHLIETEDGYFIQIQRIPHGRNSTGTSSRQPLLLSHALLTSSNSFLMLGEHSLPFILADRGYDVWLGNFRGNQYAILHRYLSRRSSDFWNFSYSIKPFHEVGFYDLPAQIDYICNYTQRNNVTLLGYSYGTTVQLVMASTRPEYQKKVLACVLIGAPSIFARAKNFFRLLAPFYQLTYSKTFTNTEIMGDSIFTRRLMQLLGLLSQKDIGIYENLQALTHRPTVDKAAKVAWFLLRYGQSATSMKILTHYYQNALAGKFQQYDYGPEENLKRYKSRNPPEYRLESITIPMGLIYKKDDNVAGKRSEDYLLNKMKNIKKVASFTDKTFNHFNFIFGLGTTEKVYAKVVEMLEFFEALYKVF